MFYMDVAMRQYSKLITYLLKGIPPINLVNLDPDQARRNAGLIWIQTGRHSARSICLKQFIDVHSMWGVGGGYW